MQDTGYKMQVENRETEAKGNYLASCIMYHGSRGEIGR